jgi:hypothetical protein
MVPTNIKSAFPGWQTEVLGSGVHIHSKVVVLDPFGENPVVMTGSHNLGFKASSANDDNLIIIEGNAPLAAAYAINIIAIYQAYRWNAYVEAHRQDPKVWHGPVDDPGWQAGYLTGDHLDEIRFWLGNGRAPVSAAAPPPARTPAKAVATPAPAQGGAAPLAGVAQQPLTGAKKGPAGKAPIAGRPKRAAAKTASTKRVTAKAGRTPSAKPAGGRKPAGTNRAARGPARSGRKRS